MGIVEKEGGFSVFVTDILNTLFLPIAEVTAQVTGKIGVYLPAIEGLRIASYAFCW